MAFQDSASKQPTSKPDLLKPKEPICLTDLISLMLALWEGKAAITTAPDPGICWMDRLVSCFPRKAHSLTHTVRFPEVYMTWQSMHMFETYLFNIHWNVH